MKHQGLMQAILAMSDMASTDIWPIVSRASSNQLIQQSPLAGCEYHVGEDLWPQTMVMKCT